MRLRSPLSCATSETPFPHVGEHRAPRGSRTGGSTRHRSPAGDARRGEAAARRSGAGGIEQHHAMQPHRRVQQDAERRACDGREARDRLVHAVDAHEMALGNELRHERGKGGAVERLRARPHGQKRKHERNAGEPSHDGDRQQQRERSGASVSQDHHPLAVEAVGRHAAKGAEQRHGQKRGGRGERKPNGRRRGLGDVPDGGEARRARGENRRRLPAPDHDDGRKPTVGQRAPSRRALGLQHRSRRGRLGWRDWRLRRCGERDMGCFHDGSFLQESFPRCRACHGIVRYPKLWGNNTVKAVFGKDQWEESAWTTC